MRLPNSTGSVFKLSGKRRKPWAVRKTTEYVLDEKNRKCVQKYSYIGYYAKKEDALNALFEFNKNPYDIDGRITFSECFEKWSKWHYASLSDATKDNYNAAYAICGAIKGRFMDELEYLDLQSIVIDSKKNKPTLKNYKSLCRQMFEFAAKYKIIPQGSVEYARNIDISQSENPDTITHVPFTEDEIRKVWDNVDKVDNLFYALLLIYTGVRPNELLNLKPENLHDGYFDVVKSKTGAGLREVPIANKIAKYFVKDPNKEYGKYFFENSQYKIQNVTTFRDQIWFPAIHAIGLEHYPYDCRHTCISLLIIRGVDDRILRSIVGHKGTGVTENVYTHIDIETKKKAINLL